MRTHKYIFAAMLGITQAGFSVNALAGKSDDTLNWATNREIAVIDPYYNNTRELVIIDGVGRVGLCATNWA